MTNAETVFLQCRRHVLLSQPTPNVPISLFILRSLSRVVICLRTAPNSASELTPVLKVILVAWAKTAL
jgi:hypothetical protein